MKTTAWLIEPPRQDISDLYSRYDVRYVFKDRSSADAYRDDPEKFFEFVQAWAKLNFQPEHYFVLTGNLTMIVAAALGLAKQFTTEKLLFLRFDHGYQRYCEVSLDAVVGQHVVVH